LPATADILQDAAAHDFRRISDWLQVSPGEINAADVKGWTVLHYAAAAEASGKDIEDIVSLLLQSGADPHQADVKGDTPFNIAAPSSPVSGRLMTLHWLGEALAGRGAKGLNDRSGSHGSTLAQYMAKWCRDDEVEALLKEAVAAGLKPDLPNAAGWTPVTAAAAMGRAAVVEAFAWHYDYAALLVRTAEEYIASYKGCRVVYAAGLTAAEVAYARLTQDDGLSPELRNNLCRTIAFLLTKYAG